MKRHFNLLASVLLVIAMVFALASCGLIDKFIPGNDQPEHEHTYVDGVCSGCNEADPNYVAPHTHNFVEGKCECGETDPNYVAPHEHNFVEGKCECGETDPNYTKPECTEHAYGAPEVTKEATCTESGERKLTCTVCGYSETKEIAPNGHTETKVPGYDPTCTAAGLSDGKVCSVCETVIVEQVEINSTGHSFVEGVCGNCGDVDPNYNGPKTYVLGVQKLTPISGKADGDTEVFGDFFTIYYSAKFKIDSSNKTFEDGFSGEQRLNWGGGTSIGSTTKNAIKFTVDGTATVKVWWVSGGTYDIKDGETVIETLPRQIGIYDENGNLVTKSNVDDSNGTQGTDGIKNDPFLSVLTISEAGTYYLGNVGNTNYFFEVAVTVTPAEAGSDTPALNGQGTTDEPFILPEAGDYVAAFPGGYDLVWYQYTPTANGYLTLSSNWEGSAWLKAGTDFNMASQNGGNGDVTIFVLAGTPVYLGVADWDEAEAKIPFTVSLEEVTLGSVDPFVGSWKGSLTSGWGGSTTYVVTINADGTGTIVADGGYYTATYDITLVVVAGDTVSFIASDDWGNSADLPVFTYDAENNKLVAASMDLVPYDPNEQPPVNPDVNYDTVIGVGSNTLYFSAEEIAANAASRTANITVAGNYKFASGNLFVASVVDANGNTLTKNDDYSYTLAEGEYTVNFGMLSMFGVSADSACTLSVEEVVSGGDVGGGDDGDDGEGSYTEPYDSLKDSLYGFYTFEGFEVFLFYNGNKGIYYANVYGEGYDLYFTYDVTENDDGSYSITLTPAEHESNSGTEYIDTVLAFEIVIGGSSDEPAVPGDVIDINTLPGTGTSADPYIITESGSYLLTEVNAYPGYLVSFGSDVEITVTVKADVAELYAKNWSKFADENVEYTFTVAAGETLPMWVVMESGTAPEVILTVEISTEGGNGGSEGGDDIGGDVGGEDPVDPAPAGVVYVGWDSWGANPLKVVVADTTITFIYSHPMRGEQVSVYTYIVSDGEIVLYDETGAAVNPLAAQVGVDANGTPVSAVYNGTSYTLLPEGQEPSFPEECYHYSTSMTETAPSCTVAGSFVVTCDDCGEVLYTESYEALGHTWVDATCTAPKTCSVCKATDGEALGHNYVDGACVCGSKMIKVNAASHSSGGNMVEGTNYAADLGLVAALFDVKGSKGNASNNIGTYSDLRMYAKDGEGNTLTFTINNGTIKSVVIKFVSDKATGCEISVGSNVVKTTTANDTTVTIEVNGNSFSLKNVNSGTTQIRISSIEITYVVPAHECEYSEATCIALATCSVCGLTKGELAECVPGEAATCTTSQICTVCKNVLVAALTHNFVNGECDREGCDAKESTSGPVAFYLVSNAGGTNYYFSGTVSSGKGGITTDVTKAAKVYKEDVDGGFYLYILDGTTRKYLGISGTSSTNFQITTTAQVLKVVTIGAYSSIGNNNNRAFSLYNKAEIRTYSSTSSSVNNYNGQNGYGFSLVEVE